MNAERSILNALYDDVPLTILELVEKTKLPHLTVLRTIPKLGGEGYLVMGGDGERKQLIFTLTNKGSALVARGEERTV